MQESKVINLFEDRDNDEKLMAIEDFPKEIVRDMWAIVEYKGTDKEYFVYAYPTELEALKIAKRIENKDKVVFKTNIVYHNVCGMKVMCGYEED